MNKPDLNLNPSVFPLEMKQEPHWLLWRLVQKEGKPKPDKVPISPKSLAACNPTSLDETTSFEKALGVWECSPNLFKGLGFSLQGGIVCIDLDHCLDEEGHPLPWAQAILDRLPASYTEVSQSGRGLHWFGLGTLTGTRTKFQLAKHQTVEIYQEKRFIALTGELFGNAPSALAESQASLDSLYQEWVTTTEKSEANPPKITPIHIEPLAISDAELLAKMFSSQNGKAVELLWNGDTSQHHHDESSADLALMAHLAFWTNGESQRMETLFSQSVLGQRDKWQREDYRQRTIAKALSGFREGYTGAFEPIQPVAIEQTDWKVPRPLQASLLPVDAFAPELLPDKARAWVEDEAHRMQAPIDYLAVTAMVVLASVIGRQVAIRPKKYDNWTVVPNLWGMVIGRPSTLKTPSIQSILKALKVIEIKEDARYQEALEKYDALVEVSKIRADANKKALTDSFKKKTAMDLEAEALRWQTENTLPPPPVRRRYMTNDCTVEKAGTLLSDNPNGFLVFRDELSGFLKKLDKDGHEEDRSFYLESWNGTGSFTFDRIGRGTTTITGVCLSLFGGIQPAVVAHWLNQATRQRGHDDGFIQRFQLMVWPDELAHYENVDTYPNLEAKQAFYEMVEKLTRLDTAALGAQQDEFDPLPYFRFSDEAQAVFSDWYSDLRNSLRTMTEQPALEAHFAKYSSLIPSLALICHLANGGCGPVSRTALLQSLAWGEYLSSHAKRAYAAASQTYLTAANSILKRLKKGDLPSPFTARMVSRKNWSGLDSHTIDHALDELEEAGYVKRVVEKGHGRPKEEFIVNPRRLKEG